MARPINLERLAEREEQARLKEEEYRLRRIRESKAFHSAQSKEHTKRLAALGQLVEDLFPDKTVTEIANLLNSVTWNMPNKWTASAPPRQKKTTVKDYSDTVIPPEACDDAVGVIE